MVSINFFHFQLDYFLKSKFKIAQALEHCFMKLSMNKAMSLCLSELEQANKNIQIALDSMNNQSLFENILKF